jgi:adenosine deaminase CECR1
MFNARGCAVLSLALPVIAGLVCRDWATNVEAFQTGETTPADSSSTYAQKRARIVEDELHTRGVSRRDLTEAERRVESYFDRCRKHDIATVRELQGNRRLVTHQRRFQAGALYRHFQQMPKGAVLHTHAAGIQDLHWLVEKAVGRPDCYVFRPRSGERSEQDGCFQLANAPPADARWQSVSKLRAQSDDPVQFDQQLYESLTLGDEDRSVDKIWDEFEQCWRRICSLSDHPQIYRDFYRRELEAVVNANAQILELRTFLDFPYREGRPVPPAEALGDLEALSRELKQKNPEFQFRIIYSRERTASLPQIETYLAEAVQLRKAFPHLVCGFDLVGHEEAGRTLLEMAPLFMQAKSQAERAGTTLPLFLHAGETAHLGFGNILDAVLLDATRIGHGLSLEDHPTLRARIKSQSIALEICPFSSYVLGNISDISQHPARAWLRDGLRISINPDNPGLMGSDLALDWYLAFVGWQLSLAELKKLVQNGIEASSLPDDERKKVMHEWENRWKLWIAGIDREATP